MVYRQKGAKACFWRMLALGAFPVTSVAVAWFSWPHLIGTEVFYIMAGIGYKPCDFEKYKLITEKAELSGNPIISRFPDSFHDLTEVSTLNSMSRTCELWYILRHLMWNTTSSINAKLNWKNMVCSSLINTTLLKMFPKS